MPPAFFGTRRRQPALFLVLLIVCLLGSQLVATTHELAVRHATCPQHGELIDVEGGKAVAEPASEVARQVTTSQVGDTQIHHQHCLFVSSRGNHKGFGVAGPAVAAIAPLAHSARSAYNAVPVPSVVVYLTAPKHSPPSV
ncbi:MAG TPA: hypothetical protein VNK82_09055 [Terriglobales bacterium]|nr:hypothetical protein [Terriglobales bacterium]